MAAALLLGLSGTALRASAAECPEFAPYDGPARALSFQDILRLPRHPDPALENSVVTTTGYLMGVREIRLPPSQCRWPNRVFRLWLAAGWPRGLKGVKHRHLALIATVPLSAVRTHLRNLHGLISLVGKRVRITGRPIYVYMRRRELWWTRGSPWEIAVADIAPCLSAACGMIGQGPAGDIIAGWRDNGVK